jgi:hypothetical protein
VLAKMKARISFELVFSLLHYSTTPSLQPTAARGKEYGSPLRGQFKAGSFGFGFFTFLAARSACLPCLILGLVIRCLQASLIQLMKYTG